MDFESSNNLLWDQNIIAHNLEYNINAELQRSGSHRPSGSRLSVQHMSYGQHKQRETFIGARQPCSAAASQAAGPSAGQATGLLDSLAASIDADITDIFGKNWQLLFLIIAIAICIIQYFHYRHVTANLVEIIKLFMCQQDLTLDLPTQPVKPVIQPVKLPSGVPSGVPSGAPSSMPSVVPSVAPQL